MRKIFFLFSFILFNITSESQISVDRTFPYDSPVYLIDNILLGGGIVASNYSFEGDSMQIGFFNAINTNLGLDSGIVLSTGDIANLVPGNLSFINPSNVVTDPDLLNVANSVPALIGQSFTVSSINDVAKLEFDFIPTSDTITFRYVFGSQEYFAFENTQYNDVFGFFLSGPGINGPYANNSVNLAIVPGSAPPLPITISSVNSVTPINQQYFVDNTQGLDTIADADGMTTVLTATAVVQCGELYHIRLAIADGTDQGLSSYVWLDAGSFKSPVLEVSNDLGLDSNFVEIPCNASITLFADGAPGSSYQWIDSNGIIISMDSSVIVGPGKYVVIATLFGCDITSDTIIIDSDLPPLIDLGSDQTIPCNTLYDLIPSVSGGTGIYSYIWSNGSTNNSIEVGEGIYTLTIDDGTGCLSVDSVIILEDPPPIVSVSGGGDLCGDIFSVDIIFNYSGLVPWELTYYDGLGTETISDIGVQNYVINTQQNGVYYPVLVQDYNGCTALISDSVFVNVYDLPDPILDPSVYVIYEGQDITLTLLNQYYSYSWYNNNDSLISSSPTLNIIDSGSYFVTVIDSNGCIGSSNLVDVNTVPLTEIFIPNSFTPNGDFHNDKLLITTKNTKVFSMKVVNRWGDLIYQTDNENKFWDGTFKGQIVPQGTYYYTIDLLGEDNVPYTKVGTVQVIH